MKAVSQSLPIGKKQTMELFYLEEGDVLRAHLLFNSSNGAGEECDFIFHFIHLFHYCLVLVIPLFLQFREPGCLLISQELVQSFKLLSYLSLSVLCLKLKR